jgi:hypothetical protein
METGGEMFAKVFSFSFSIIYTVTAENGNKLIVWRSKTMEPYEWKLMQTTRGEKLKKVKILNFAAETNKLMLGTGLK